jgi:hypothetical protein
MWYADWRHNGPPPRSQLQAVAARGSVPEITWEPWDASRGLYRSQPRYRLRNIIDGRFDAYIESWARDLSAWRGPVLLRFAQEMDGDWYPWDEHANGNHLGEFGRAWRHVHHIFVSAGAMNVKWIWSPAFAISTEQFPGESYVDMLGLTCINSGGSQHPSSWRSFAGICAGPIGQLHRLAPRTHIQLSEVATGAVHGSRARWIGGMFSFLKRHPEVSSFIWFDVRTRRNWVIESSPAVRRQFARGLRHYLRERAADAPDIAATSRR